MILYDKLWEYMKRKNVSQYYLVTHGIAHSTITRLKRNQPVSTETLDRVCSLLNCNLQDVAEHVKDDV